MKASKYLLIAFVAAVGCVTCSCDRDVKETDERVLSSLNRAGRNKVELEKALQHYDPEKDPEKYAAVRFLVANMYGHYGYDGPELDSIESVLAPLVKKKVNFYLDPNDLAHWENFSFFALPRKDDVRYISADYLINNVEHAYKRWKNRPWNNTLSFDDFCELLLPYCIGDERFTEWREAYSDFFEPKLDSLYSGADAVEAARILLEITQNVGWAYNAQLVTPHRDATSLLKTRVGYNRDKCDYLAYAMRACGIPVAIDALLIAPDSRNAHNWLVVRDNVTGKYIPFGADDMVPDRDNPPVVPRAKGKVYRTRYGRQEERGKELADVRSLPVRINNIFLEDVSAEYFGSNSASVDVVLDEGTQVFLGMWVPMEWRAVDIGEMLADGKAKFTDMEPGVLFVPEKLSGNQFLPCGDAFYLGFDGECYVLKPDTKSVEKVRLNRTLPQKNVQVTRMADDVIGGRFEMSRTADFRHPVKIHEITDTLNERRVIIDIPDSLSTWKYIRYTAPKDRRFTVESLKPYADDDLNEQIPAKLIDNIGAPYEPEYLFDNTHYTNYTAPRGMDYATIAINDTKPIKKLEFVPYVDRYFVIQGNEYELFYFDGSEGWKSLGVKKPGKDEYVEFVVPANSLMMLRDVTTGTGGQVFIYRDNRQIYSYQLSK